MHGAVNKTKINGWPNGQPWFTPMTRRVSCSTIFILYSISYLYSYIYSYYYRALLALSIICSTFHDLTIFPIILLFIFLLLSGPIGPIYYLFNLPWSYSVTLFLFIFPISSPCPVYISCIKLYLHINYPVIKNSH